jgi:hypothetical protein
MTEFLYKVSEPRENWAFEPRPFWRAEDWSFSDDQDRDGLTRDSVLYAGEFDEINIHLLPKVWRLRVWLDDEERCARLKDLGFSWSEGSRAVIFALEADRDSIESFRPTIFTFEKSGFEQIPTGEFVSWEPRVAVSSETLSFHAARERWRFDLIYVPDAEALEQSLRSAGVDHQIDASDDHPPFN